MTVKMIVRRMATVTTNVDGDSSGCALSAAVCIVASPHDGGSVAISVVAMLIMLLLMLMILEVAM